MDKQGAQEAAKHLWLAASALRSDPEHPRWYDDEATMVDDLAISIGKEHGFTYDDVFPQGE